ncbi:hypothetical protein [Methanosarcina barkeri]|uniref:hypothetical protein n=1 Tax=Methanosarcina barkeri TaxID=2208 RepID=UPI000A6C2C26|nr:hypothetical protein [Methanosarcina barkeri]
MIILKVAIFKKLWKRLQKRIKPGKRKELQDTLVVFPIFNSRAPDTIKNRLGADISFI